MSSFAETAGAFMYVVVNYLDGSDIITSVADGSVDQFDYVGGEFANVQSVAFYDVPVEHGGTVTITVTISSVEFGSCRAGQLTPGTQVGDIGIGNSTGYGTSLDLTNPAGHAPSLLLAIIGTSRPSGASTMSAPAGNWLDGGGLGTGWNPGANSDMYGYNATVPGTVTFAYSCTSPVSISGIAVEFVRGEYPVTFHETGLASGTPWWVLLNGTFAGSTGSSIVYLEENGSFAFSVVAVAGYSSNVSSGKVTISGAGVSVNISFSPLNARPVAFQESGLPSGTTWTVELNGTLAVSTTSTVQFAVSSGTYSFQVGAVPGYASNVTSGQVSVGSSAVVVRIGFSLQGTLPIFFVESGLPVGTSWSVSVNGTLASSTSSTIMFAESKGTYAYAVGAVSGFVANKTSGQLTLSASSTTVRINFTSAPSSGASSPTFTWTDTEWFAIGVAVGAVVVAAVALVLRGRRRPAPASPWPEGVPTPGLPSRPK
jgi:hypothetical protein